MEAGEAVKTYKIGQAAKVLDVKPFVLRFWESEFRQVLVPVRTPSGQRAYTEDNLATVREIKRLLYEEGLTIEGAKKRLLSGADQIGSHARSHVSSHVDLHGGDPATTKPDEHLGARTVEQAVEYTVEQAGGPARASAPQAPASSPHPALLREITRELAAIRDLLT